MPPNARCLGHQLKILEKGRQAGVIAQLGDGAEAGLDDGLGGHAELACDRFVRCAGSVPSAEERPGAPGDGIDGIAERGSELVFDEGRIAGDLTESYRIVFRDRRFTRDSSPFSPVHRKTFARSGTNEIGEKIVDGWELGATLPKADHNGLDGVFGGGGIVRADSVQHAREHARRVPEEERRECRSGDRLIVSAQLLQKNCIS